MKIEYLVISAAVGFLIGFMLGRMRPKNMNIYQFLHKIYTNLDNFILIFSLVVVLGSIYFSTIGKIKVFASVTINVFGSTVFSWLLTKKSSKVEFKEEEQELALRSFRHINYIESAANTAYKKIENYLSDEYELDEKAKLILGSAMDQIKYIQGGINTCKMDWHDMLSDEEKERHKNDTTNEDSMDNDYGTVDVVVPATGYNQEDA